MIFNRSYLKMALGALAFTTAISCKKSEDAPVTPKANELTGDLATQTLDASKQYLLKGYVFVRSGQTLTIPAGTIIMGDKATKGTLVIDKGGKIEAIGTVDKPIIFTSEADPGERDKGDWGGIILLGNANVNQTSPAIEGVNPAVTYGTTNSTANDGESSGTLKFVRIEFAGIALSPNNEINGLTLGGVGNGTVIENVQVSFSGDDAFEWFGGTVNAKNLVALGTWDDDFDTDFGFTGKIQFALAVRDPYSADQSGSNGFESDNDAAGSDKLPITAPVFSNVSLFGPRFDTTTAISGNYQHAAHIRRRSAISIVNSVISGFPTGIRLDGKTTYANYDNGTGLLANNLLLSLHASKVSPKPFMGSGTVDVADTTVRNYFRDNNTAGWFTRLPLDFAGLGIDQSLYFGKASPYLSNPSFGVSAGTITSGSSFSSSRLSAGFFTNVPYIGAFGGTDWTDSWANFDPKNTIY